MKEQVPGFGLQVSEESLSSNILDKWRGLFVGELKRVDGIILAITENEAALIPQIVQHILASGGKRLRPVLTILSGKLCGYEGSRHVQLAAAIELLHTATLLHDDVVDESKLRRGVDTANNVWGNAASVLVGDYLLGKAFQLMARDGSIKVLEILSDASSVITEGEVKQLMAAGDITTTQEAYTDIIARKTAQLFAAACRVGAVVAERPEAEERALESFGRYLGVAFQIADDALDYSATQERLGKTIGDDFREGKVTLPVILAYARGDAAEKLFWERVIGGEQREGDLARAVEYIQRHNALPDTMGCAREYAGKAAAALEIFPVSEIKTALLELLEFSVSRPY